MHNYKAIISRGLFYCVQCRRSSRYQFILCLSLLNPPRPTSAMGFCRAVSLLAGISLFSIAGAVPSPRRNWDVHSGLQGGPGSSYIRRSVPEADNATCAAPQDIPVRALRPSPFLPLSADEVASISDWLYQPERGLNLTASSSETLSQSDNYIWIIEALYPNKTGILSYLDSNASIPDKYARVAINEGGKLVPDVSEYYVSCQSFLQLSNILIFSRLDRCQYHPRLQLKA